MMVPTIADCNRLVWQNCVV